MNQGFHFWLGAAFLVGAHAGPGQAKQFGKSRLAQLFNRAQLADILSNI